MPITQISRIQHRRGLQTDLPQLATAELGWAIDTQKLYIGSGTISEGAPTEGNTQILTVSQNGSIVIDYQPLPAIVTTVTHKIPVVYNGNTYYIHVSENQ